MAKACHALIQKLMKQLRESGAVTDKDLERYIKEEIKGEKNKVND